VGIKILLYKLLQHSNTNECPTIGMDVQTLTSCWYHTAFCQMICDSTLFLPIM